MEMEDIIDLPASSRSDDNDFQSCNRGPSDADFQPSNSEVKLDNLNAQISEIADHDVEETETKPLLAADLNEDLYESSSVLEARSVLTDTIAVKENVKEVSPISNRKRDGSPANDHGVGDSPAKRARITKDVQQPSVHITYNHLTRDSKAKLEELLQKWSQWHAQQYSSSPDSDEVLESGEEVYFPAFRVGVDNSAVSFWMDNQTRSQQSGEFVELDSKSVPLYDRGYSLEGGLEILDASRCFNCGSYNHSLKECSKPRDNAAVNNARKQQKSKRNQNANSRNPTRYYEDSPGGKYDGLKPGVLDAETRKLLGLGELDPPPWLNRMRELGYPPGYLDPEDEGQPSGITIFGEEEKKVEMEDGEIPETSNDPPPRKTSPPTKMSVQFPGINAPIPEDADERKWESRTDYPRNRSHHRSNYSSEQGSRGQYNDQRRSSRDYRDDGPPGVESWSPTISSPSPRYNNNSYESSYASHSARDDNAIIPRSPSFGRSFSDRGRRSPLVYESSPPSRWSPSHDYGSASFEERYGDRQNGGGSDSNYSSHRKEKHHDKHHHRSWR